MLTQWITRYVDVMFYYKNCSRISTSFCAVIYNKIIVSSIFPYPKPYYNKFSYIYSSLTLTSCIFFCKHVERYLYCINFNTIFSTPTTPPYPLWPVDWYFSECVCVPVASWKIYINRDIHISIILCYMLKT